MYRVSKDKLVQIEDLVYGTSRDDRLIVAYFRYVEPGGRVVTKDARAWAKTVFDSPADVHGVKVKVGGRDIWADTIVFVADSDGIFELDSFTGSHDGQAFTQLSAAMEVGSQTCRFKKVGTECWNLYDGCTPGCGPAPDCICPIFPNAACAPLDILECRGTCPHAGDECGRGTDGWCHCD